MPVLHRSIASSIAAVTSGALILGIAPAAFAADEPSAAAKAAATVENITGTDDLAHTTAGGGDQAAKAVTDTEAVKVTVTAPSASTGKVEATAPDGTGLGLSLPSTKSTTGTKAGSGTVVYPDAAPSTDIAVQPTIDGGVRSLVTLKDGKAATSQRFELSLPANTEIASNEDGGYDLIREIGDETAVAIGTIDAPWAKDAGGRDLPTNYKLEGNTLVQSIETNSGTAFPVVADPKVTWGWVTGTIYFNRKETRRIALGGGLGATAIAAIPGGFTTVIGVTMAAITARASAAYDRGRCLRIKLPHVYPDHYKGGHCR
ncbi:hypothetical protein [Streptomyces sp. BA2]|uniref:hypothetical protein n=1 Tax=Streptomyces sp. BA2 TaxID=436595 RepID=UPI0013295D31|nr:hypothetical protein [Streptomyces sp. BA2]MWA07914.1 hypothetical protein [Streptomyces sp. BA2]